MSRICIFGGSGFVGRAITKQAVAAGHQVTVACRHPERARDMLVEGVKLVKADITQAQAVRNTVAGHDCVINLVGLLFQAGRNTFSAAHVQGTEHILAGCKDAGIQQYLHMSALGAGEVPDSLYASSKAEAEAHVRKSGLNWTIFRPSIIYGDNDSFFNKFKDMLKLAPVLPLIAGEARFQPVWVEDVARAFILSINNRHAAGQTFALGGPKTYSFRELMVMLMTTMGVHRLLLPVPMFAAKIMAFFMQLLPVPPLTPDQLKLLQHDNVIKGRNFPDMFGEAAKLEAVLPTYIRVSALEEFHQHLDQSRTSYRKLR